MTASNGSTMLAFSNLGLSFPEQARIESITLSFRWKAILANYTLKPSVTWRLIADVNQWDGYYLEMTEVRTFGSASFNAMIASFTLSPSYLWTPSMLNKPNFGFGFEFNAVNFSRGMVIACVNLSANYDNVVTTVKYPLTTFQSTTMRPTTAAVTSSQSQARNAATANLTIDQISVGSNELVWNNLESLKCNGVDYASISLEPFRSSSRLVVSKFGFEVPSYGNINSVEVTVTRSTTSSPTPMEYYWILGVGQSNVSSRLAAVTWYNFWFNEVYTFGVSGKFNYSMINSDDFYFGFNFKNMPEVNETALISCVQLRVLYSIPSTTKPLTTSPLTTGGLTTQPLTTQPLTTEPGLTTGELTTNPLTTTELTTASLTTGELTTSPLTTRELTTGDVTTQEISPTSTSDMNSSTDGSTSSPGGVTGDGDSTESSSTSDEIGWKVGVGVGVPVGLFVVGALAGIFLCGSRRKRMLP
eukprot:TRINITY_DN1293_c0_g1_i2.p1 TRINITY_DN1293_c0_g1~~TRINITY_DN1293_c0_g1_i2.p1  ORF type:complete len:539 (+),score=97.93 TRINITY_DN1293_c0_g1_i2:202-1617(+)